MVEESKTYLGIVENNNDPDREGKCQIRVITVFDNIPTSDIPWAIPQKDLNGVEFSLPDVGKVVSVVFENGNIYNPIYRYSEHFNVNLEDKLGNLDDGDYTSMKALIFDHLTQIYVNDGEGLKMDHKFNMINITEDSININLKDNMGSVNIGTENAQQQAILGNNYLNWFDEFVDHLLGSQAGPFIGNLGAPVIPNPSFITLLLKYKAIKESKFLSHNVNFVDNGYVDKLNRVNINQRGDNWKSTLGENDITDTNTPTGYEPASGIKDNTPTGTLTTSEELSGEEEPHTEVLQSPPEGEVNPDIEVILQTMRNKGYEIYNDPYKLNIIGVRYQYNGQKYTNKFVDRLYAVWTDGDGVWNLKYWMISTMPGVSIRIREKHITKGVPSSLIGKRISLKKYANYLGRSGLAVLVPAQYVNAFKLGTFSKHKALKSISEQIVYRDSNWDSENITYSSREQGRFGIHIHRGFPSGTVVNNWSEGCQVFSNKKSLGEFANMCEKHRKKYGNAFTYTLVTSKDLEETEDNL